MKRHFVWKPCTEMGDTQFTHEKIRKLPGARGEFLGEFRLRGFREKFGIIILDHCRTRPRADDNHLGIFQMLHNFGGNRTRLVPIAGVESRLAAAGNLFRADDRMAESFEDFHHADARARKQRVHKTWDEKSDDHCKLWLRWRNAANR